jgi:hypothetical protein
LPLLSDRFNRGRFRASFAGGTVLVTLVAVATEHFHGPRTLPIVITAVFILSSTLYLYFTGLRHQVRRDWHKSMTHGLVIALVVLAWAVVMVKLPLAVTNAIGLIALAFVVLYLFWRDYRTQ